MAKQPSVTILTSRYDKALTMVRTLQNGEARKGGGTVPYLSHSIGVSALVLQYGGTEDQAIAALLHDVAEDNGGERMLSVIEAEFDSKIAGHVRDLSDSLVEDSENKEAWYPRKTKYIETYSTKHTDVLLISAADKLHNVRAMVSDHKSVKGQLWLRFDRKVEAPIEDKRTQQIWYQSQLVKVLNERLAGVQPYGAQLARDLQDELTALKQSISDLEGVSLEDLDAAVNSFSG
jgi:(p)ppGpp synthase/HD superfamily hydrolase